LEVDETEVRDFDKDEENFLSVLAHLVGAAIARHRAQARTQQSAQEDAARAQKTELRLQELHHRIKNNFQLVVSVLLFHQRRLADPDARDALRRVAEKVISIGMAHDQLNVGSTPRAVEMAAYLKALVARVAPANPAITIEVEIDEIQLSLDRAVVVGLIVNEAIANADKHAFREKQTGTIRVVLRSNAGEIEVMVADTGDGIQTGRAGAQGLVLLTRLAEQISGKIAVESAPGAGCAVRVTFPQI